MRFRFCVDSISWDFVFVLTRFLEVSFLCWPNFTMLTRFHVIFSLDDPISWDVVFVLTRFHEFSFLCWPDFTMLTQFHEIYSRHHRNFDCCYNLAPQYTASLCVLYVFAAEYSGRSHTKGFIETTSMLVSNSIINISRRRSFHITRSTQFSLSQLVRDCRSRSVTV